MFSTTTSNDYIVYQVKFTKNALKETNPHKSIVDSLRTELPRISANILDKAKKYIVITNVRGTGPLDAGSIDVVQALLNKHLSVPSQCWWRDDIERRLDDAWDIKWAFPEVFSRFDILRIILEHNSSEDALRRLAAVRAFLREQYDFDTDLRFKQIELQNKLLDLFIDVPIDVGEDPEFRRGQHELATLLDAVSQQGVSSSGSATTLGAASLLLNPLTQGHLPWVVLEGAPGQGKSTIVQYICQVHRERLLNSAGIEGRLQTEHGDVPLKLPFKVDCRDFAVWLSGKNPFLSEEQGVERSAGYRTLERFLAAQVEYHSGGMVFSVDDLREILSKSATLVVFDGLDEVADIGERRTVVEEIKKGTRRMAGYSAAFQCIVTSRPTAFTNSPGLPRDQFQYLQLGSIDREIIVDYAEKWIRARGLKGEAARSVRNILRDKLDQPHLRDLARNPMQLTILLSLIHTKGPSLPDKRTALYDNYINLFFDREAEKSEIVRQQRELLMQIHRYLAWVLHSEAQTDGTGGKVDAGRLRELVAMFLKKGGHNVDLAEKLFSGVVDRVVALVSRIEGTYEFEVQPMREYFVARYLYDTAPYSPAGDIKPGTLPERFDALARDFFWQNVTRFYAGCYSQGELPSLLESLVSLSKAPTYGVSCYAPSLANTLLADYTFSQYPRIISQVVEFVLDDRWFRLLVSVDRQGGRGESWHWSEENGRERLVTKCFDELQKLPERDYAQILVEIIRANTDVAERRKRWWTVRSELHGEKLTQWMSYGMSLKVLQQCANTDLDGLLDEGSECSRRLMLLAFNGLWGYVSAEEERVASVVDEILDRNNVPPFGGSGEPLERFVAALSSYMYSISYTGRMLIPLEDIWERHRVLESGDEGTDDARDAGNAMLEKCKAFAAKSEELMRHRSGGVWATDLEPWTELVEHGRGLFGERWAFCVLANAGAGVRSKEMQCKEARDLFDRGVPLVQRARHARLRAGQTKWWRSQLENVTDDLDVAFGLLLLFTWCGRTVFRDLGELIDEKVRGLDATWWNKVCVALENPDHGGYGGRTLKLTDVAVGEFMSERTAVALSRRCNEAARREVFDTRLNGYAGDELSVVNYCQEMAVRWAFRRETTEWDRWLAIISDGYRKGGRWLTGGGRWIFGAGNYRLPREVAYKVVAESSAYPTVLVGWAEEFCRTYIAKQLVPVGRVASRDNWFQN